MSLVNSVSVKKQDVFEDNRIVLFLEKHPALRNWGNDSRRTIHTIQSISNYYRT